MAETFVRSADWSGAGTRGHAVQFYPNEGYLLDLLTRFVGTALVTGDVAIVVATKAHRDGLARRLRARGFDIRVPRTEGRYVPLDAQAMLAKVSRDGALDADLFRRVFGTIFARVSNGAERRRVAAFGEMVSVLWGEGRHESVIHLEQMWNDLARDYAFSLCCAYPMDGFGNRHAASFMKICAQHSQVFTIAAGDGHGLQAPARALA